MLFGEVAATAVAAAASSAPRESFDEALIARPLADGALLLFANLSVSVRGRDWRHLSLFPRAAAELSITARAM